MAPLSAGRPRVFLGRSLGTGLAVALATVEQPELTVLVSPNFSMQALAAEHYPFVPSALLRYPLRTDQMLPRVEGPLLLVHGARDRLIEPGYSARLQALIPQAQRVVLGGAGHNDLQDFAAYGEVLSAAFKSLVHGP